MEIYISTNISGYTDLSLTSPRNSLSSSWTLGWSHTVISSMRSLKSRRWTWEYIKVWFHLGSALFFTVLVRLLLLSLEQRCKHVQITTGRLSEEGWWGRPSILKVNMNTHIVDTNTHIYNVPSVRQEVHLDIGVTRSPIGSGWQVYGLKDVDNQLMTHFVVPQLHL